MSDKNNTFEYQVAHSPLKESVLNWYDFKCDASVLLIGERSCGLKELFLRRGCEVTVHGESDGKSQYDYVIALDEIEMQRDPQEKVREWTAYVKSEGSKPMNVVWKLRKPIPAKYLKKTNQLTVG